MDPADQALIDITKYVIDLKIEILSLKEEVLSLQSKREKLLKTLTDIEDYIMVVNVEKPKETVRGLLRELYINTDFGKNH